MRVCVVLGDFWVVVRRRETVGWMVWGELVLAVFDGEGRGVREREGLGAVRRERSRGRGRES